MTTITRVLLVEDSPDDPDLLQLELQRAGFNPVCARVETPEEMLAALETGPWDVVLSDFSLPNFSGLDALNLVRANQYDLPFIFVSGAMGEDVAVDAMRHGADDYLLKDRLARLGPAVEQALTRHRLQVEKQLAEQNTARLAAIIESSADAILATTLEGVITNWNPGAERLYGYMAAEILGKHVGVLLPPRRRRSDIPEDHEDLARRMCSGERVEAYETVRVRKDGRRVDVLVSISPIRNPGGNVLGASVIAHDTTDRKRAERFLAAEHATTRILTEYHTLEEASPKLLQTLAETLRWEVAVLWQVDQHANVLRRIHTWHSPWAEASFLADLGQQMVLTPGEGLAGRAWGGGEPIWESVVLPPTDGTGQSAATGGGLRGAFGLPMRVGSRMVGVIEFYNPELRQPDAAILAALDNIAIQVSQFSDRRESEADLRESEQRFRQLAENIREVFWVRDARDGRILYVSPAYEDVWGRSRQSLYDHPLSYLEAVHPEDRDRVAAAFDHRQMVSAVEMEYRILRPDGLCRWVWERSYPVHGPQGEIERFVGTAEDITVRKQAEEAVFQLASIVVNSEDAIIGEDLDGRITSWNPGAERLYGYAAGEVLGRPGSLLAPADEPSASPILDSVMQGARIAPHETVRVRKDGSRVDVSLSISPIRDAAGRVIGAAKMARDITDMRRANERLLHSQREAARHLALLETLLGNAPVGFAFLDRDFHFVQANDALAAVTGVPAAAMIGRTVEEVVPTVWSQVEPVCQGLLADGTPSVNREIRVETRAAPGRMRHCLVSHFPVRIDDEIIGIGIVVNDITGQKQDEEALRRLAAIVRDSSDAIISITLERVITSWNPGAERLYGYAAAEVVGQPHSTIIPPSHAEEFEDLMVRMRRGERVGSYETVRVKKGGSLVHVFVTISPLQDAAGQVVGVSSIARDITERKLAERRLAEAARAKEETLALLETLLRYAPVGFAFIDRQFRYARCNESLAAMNGLPPADHIGRTVAEVVPALWPQVKSAYCTTLASGEPQSGLAISGETAAAPGKARHYLASLYPVRVGGEVVGVGVVVVDLTEHRSLEEQFRQAQKMEAVGRLAGGVAHDFNNLLTIINGYGEIVSGSLPAGHPAKELVRQIRDAGERAAGLTRQLLAFSRKTVLEPKVLDLNCQVREMEKLLLRLIGEDIDLATRLDPDLGRVKADAGQLEQAVVNLCVNARDAMPQGGKLTIETHNATLDDAYAQEHPDVKPGPHVLLAVSDTGHGMDAATKAHIFEPFFTTKAPGKGTGLGLAMVFGFVKQSGGHIAVYSEPGQGTTFKLYLPRVQGAVSSGKSHPGLSVLPKGNETILLVEDEDGVRALARHLLQTCGYAVLEASHGKEALGVAERHTGPLHLLITDVVMPQGMGGRQVAVAVRALHPEARVLFVSGYTDDAVVRHGVLEANTNFLQKPFTPTTLAQKVREVLDQSPTAGRE